MSHFTVLVVGDDVERQLEPFWELDLELDELREDPRAVFQDRTEEVREEWESETIERIVCEATGESFYLWDEGLREKLTGDRHKHLDKDNLPEGYVLRNVPYKEIFADMADFADDYHGYIIEGDKVGFYSNPDAKWDWYSVGGRWSGFFRLKKGAAGEIGKPGVFGHGHEEAESGDYADSCLKGEIDVAWMRSRARMRAEDYFKSIDTVLKDLELPPSWEDVRDKMFPGDIEAARQFYNNHPANVALREAKVGAGPFGDSLADYRKGRDALVKNAEDNAITTYAVLMDGKWCQRGEMGWFGSSTGEKAPGEWEREYAKMFDDLDDNTVVTIVDCHI